MSGAAAGLAATQLPFAAARAQVIQQTTRVVIPFPAGGSTDTLARILADKLKGVYAPTTIVENKVGAAGRIAVEYVKNAEADGSVMLFTPDFLMTVYPHSFRSLNYDPLRDFTPVATVAKSALCMSVGPAVPAEVKTLSDFVAWCKANPKNATHATTAAGGTPHFAGLMLSQASKVEMTPVHYKGGAPALQDLIGGHVSSSVNPVGEVLPFAKTGKIRVLAVTSAKRSAFLPDVPTMKESGYDVVIEAWLGALVPSKTPAEIVSKLNLVIKDAFSAPDVMQKLSALGNEPDYKTPAEFAATVKDDIARWGPVVKASGFVAD
ncbi:MAG: Bug family tripartite tricarboxylate transporter substrate binding protein [Pseudorhodoplanes sp.]